MFPCLNFNIMLKFNDSSAAIWHSLRVILQDFPCTQSLQASNLQLHGLPILISKLALSSFLPTRIIQLTCSRMSLQKQGMNMFTMSSSAVPLYPQSLAARVIYLARGLSINSATIGIPTVIDSIDNDKSPFSFNLR